MNPTPAKTATKTPAAKTESSITEPQMRHLHALIHDRTGLTVRDDVLEYLSTALGREVTTRNSLTDTEAKALITSLTEYPPAAVLPHDPRWRDLRAPFPEEAIGKLPRSTCKECSKSPRKRCDSHQWVWKCPVCHGNHTSASMHIDYVGHADITARLLAVDPLWTWEPMGLDQFGNPAYDRDGNLWIRLTVLGVTRVGVGDAGNDKGAKERIGDALRNAAMRFGIALDLWAKGDREWSKVASRDDHEPNMDPAAPTEPAAPYDGPSNAELVEQLEALAADTGTTLAGITEKFRTAEGGLDVPDLYAVDPDLLNRLVYKITTYLAEHPPVAPVSA